MLLTLSIILGALVTIGLAQGLQESYPVGGYIIFPLSLTQCEPVLIFYNVTQVEKLVLFPPDHQASVLSFFLPVGNGYLEWICDIPAGHGFYAFNQYFIVQPGSSSSCLGDITTTYVYATYFATPFQSYTAHLYAPTSVATPSGVPFPSGSFSTITVNPDLAVALPSSAPIPPPPSLPSTALSLSSATLSSTTLPSTTITTTAKSAKSLSPTATSNPVSPTVSHQKLNAAAIVGGTIGGIALVLLVSILVFLWWRRRHHKRAIDDLSTPFVSEQQAKWMKLEPLPATTIRSDRSTHKLQVTQQSDHPADQSIPTPPIEPMHETVTQPTNESNGSESQSPLAVALAMVSHLRPNASQREVLVNSLNDLSDDATSSDTLQEVAHAQQQHQQQQQEPGAVEIQNDGANLLSILNSFSLLDPRERQTLMSVLGNLVALNSPDELMMTGSVVSGPPPYSD